MYNNEGAPGYFYHQGGLYYPPTPTPTPTPTPPANYGCISTGFDSTANWDDQYRGFTMDAQQVQHAGAQNDSYPFLCYTSSFGYGHSPYNPYNPYIPGAVAGVEGPSIGTEHYYTFPSYDNSSSSPVAYFYIPPHSKPGLVATDATDASVDANSSHNYRSYGSVCKQSTPSAFSAFTSTLLESESDKSISFVRASSDGTRKSPVASKQPTAHANVTFSTSSIPTLSQILQDGGGQVPEYLPRGTVLPCHGHLKAAFPQNHGLSEFGSAMHGQLKSKFLYRRANDTKIITDVLAEQNQVPRIDKGKNQLRVRTYTTTAGDADGQGNIIIYFDRYNKDDFWVDYTNAKFFVIKSFSEGDVHKSIKYGVWSSTHNGNKKLNNAYEDAQRIPNKDSGGCPIFLFFSVNGSGQFCGFAEMIGPVDFQKDMDFWEQDKWSGCFPVKWHVIKDVPNSRFKHILLENNDHKPVTFSRDSQEVRFTKGIEMLKAFKNYVSKSCLLDDFLYYENREESLWEGKGNLLISSHEYPFPVPVLEPPQTKCGHGLPSKVNDHETKHKQSTNSCGDAAASVEMAGLEGCTKSKIAANACSMVVSGGEASNDTLTIHSKQSEPDLSELVGATLADSASTGVLTIGSIPVKIDGLVADSSGFLRFGARVVALELPSRTGNLGRQG